MSSFMTWLTAFLTIAVLVLYEAVLLQVQRRHPGRLARSAHADLREQWFTAISRQPGSEVLAVQTLRNALMAATMTASTALLGLMGTLTLAAPSLHAVFDATGIGSLHFTARLALELALMALLFASLVSSSMAVRYYNHAGFVSGMPVGSAERERWSDTGVAYLRRAGMLYSWGLRHLLLVAPLVASILHPAAGPPAAGLVVAVLYGFDRFNAAG